MGLLAWITRAVGRDLDRRVSGSQGTAEGRFEPVIDDLPLRARVQLAEAQGTVELRAAGRQERGIGSAAAEVGPGRDLHGQTVSAEAEASGTPGALASLTLELSQGTERRETYSVEGRLDAGGRARLRLSVSLG
jgi:hypothetical protein